MTYNIIPSLEEIAMTYNIITSTYIIKIEELDKLCQKRELGKEDQFIMRCLLEIGGKNTGSYSFPIHESWIQRANELWKKYK